MGWRRGSGEWGAKDEIRVASRGADAKTRWLRSFASLRMTTFDFVENTRIAVVEIPSSKHSGQVFVETHLKMTGSECWFPRGAGINAWAG